MFNSHAEVLIISCKNIAVTTEIKVAEGKSQKGTECVDFKYLCKYLSELKYLCKNYRNGLKFL